MIVISASNVELGCNYDQKGSANGCSETCCKKMAYVSLETIWSSSNEYILL